MPELKKLTLSSGEVVEVFDGSNEQNVDNKESKDEDINWIKSGYLKSLNGNWIYPMDYLDAEKKLYDLEYRPTDVFVNGSPKSGTTWIQEIVWNLLHNIDMNHPLKGQHSLMKIPFFEVDAFGHSQGGDWYLSVLSQVLNIPIKLKVYDMMDDMPDSRIFKTHLFPSAVNKDMLEVSKTVYCVRNPLDSCHSYYLFHRYLPGLMGSTKDLEEFFEKYIKGELYAGNAVEHLRHWLPYREHKNVHFIFYEELRQNPITEVKKLAEFLGKKATDDQINAVIEQSSFKNMKANSELADKELRKEVGAKETDEQGGFFRKGVAGDSKNMPKDIYNKFVEFFDKNLKDLDLPYKFTKQ